jgi:UDP-N-acetylmuramoyl-L-alanyl-D-glutamate--2,6-diaminopimelate ligase
LQAHSARGAAWARAFDALRPEGLAVLNVDCRHAARLVERLDGPVLTVSVREAAEITALSIESLDCEQTFLLTAGDDTLPVRIPLVGPHQMTNCLLAAAVGLGYGLDLPTIVRGLEAVPGVPGRLERIEAGQPFRVFLDAGRSPAALATALDTLRSVTSGRLICVCSAAGADAAASHAALHAALESAAEVAIVTAAANTADALATTFAGPSVAGCLAGGVRVIEDRQAIACSWPAVACRSVPARRPRRRSPKIAAWSATGLRGTVVRGSSWGRSH